MKDIPLKELVPMIDFVRGFAADRDIVPELKYLFTTKSMLCAYNGAAGAILKQKFFEEAVAMPGLEVAQMIGSLEKQGFETVDISFDGQRMTIKSRKFKTTMPLLVAEAEAPREYVTRKVPKANAELTAAFWSNLAKVEPVVCKDEQKKMLRGVYWSDTGQFAACDNFRMSLVTPTKDKVACPVKNGVLLPDYLLQLVLANRAAYVGTTVEDNTVWFHMDNGSAYGQKIEGEFPAKQILEIFKTMKAGIKDATQVVLPGDDSRMFEMVLDRLLLVAQAPTYKVKVEVMKRDVRFSTVVEDGSGFEAEETVSATSVKGEPVEFTVNGKHLKDALAVSLQFAYVAEKPVYFSNKDTQTEHLLMLLRD